MKKKIAWMSATGMCPEQIDETYTETPKALVGADGLPNKGRKNSTTAYLAKCYNGVLQNLPASWKPHSVIIDGMVLYGTPHRLSLI